MGLLKSLADFMLGKDPDIFDSNGRVQHKFTEDKWRKWDDRLKANPEYDFRQHVGVEKSKQASVPPKKN